MNTIFEFLPQKAWENRNMEKVAHEINTSQLRWHYSSGCDRLWFPEDGNETKTKAIFCRDRIDLNDEVFLVADKKPCPLSCGDCPLRRYGVTTIDPITINNPYSPKNVAVIRRECQRNGFVPEIKPVKKIRLRKKYAKTL